MSSFFNGDEFSKDIFTTKYSGIFGSDVEGFFRSLAELVSLDDQALSSQFYELFINKRMAPGGRILAFGGRPDAHVSLMNCTTHSIPGDSLEDISDTGYTIMRASSRGQGIGIDLSRLRPRSAPVNNAAKTSTGAISFMELLNNIGGTIGQEGRRAAMLFSMDVSHPDLYRPDAKDVQCPKCSGKGCSYCNHTGYIPYDFLHVKKLPGRVENANISVRLSDAFMEAVQKNQPWTMHFEGQSSAGPFSVSDQIPARELFHELAKSAYMSAEPGVLYWDTSKEMSNSDLFGYPVVSTNACVTGDSVIVTEDGPITIEELAKLQEYPKVLTRNEKTDALEWEKPAFVGPTRKESTVRVLKVKAGDAFITLRATYDHLVFNTACGWLPMGAFREGDTILYYSAGGTLVTGTVVKTDFDFSRGPVYDITLNKNHNFFADSINVHNCSEEVLDQDGVCDLGSMNLTKYIRNPFTSQSYFDYTSFRQDVALSIEFLDNVVSLELERGYYISEQQRLSLKNIRRLGLGVMGLADMLAMMGLYYGASVNTLSFIRDVFREMRDAAYQASIDLAIEKGPAPVWLNKSREEREAIVEKGFFQTLPEHIKNQIISFGTRNITLLSVAPTGSISNLFGVSSGVEPVFAHSYVRRTRMHGRDEFIEYIHPPLAQALDMGVVNAHDLWPTAYEVTPMDHLAVQAAAQEFVDASIAKTLNMPASSTIEDVEEAYMNGWKAGLKGMAIYRDGSRYEQVLMTKQAEEEPVEEPSYSEPEEGNACPMCGAQLVHESGCVKCPSCEYSLCSL